VFRPDSERNMVGKTLGHIKESVLVSRKKITTHKDMASNTKSHLLLFGEILYMSLCPFFVAQTPRVPS